MEMPFCVNRADNRRATALRGVAPSGRAEQRLSAGRAAETRLMKESFRRRGAKRSQRRKLSFTVCIGSCNSFFFQDELLQRSPRKPAKTVSPQGATPSPAWKQQVPAALMQTTNHIIHCLSPHSRRKKALCNYADRYSFFCSLWRSLRQTCKTTQRRQ